MCGIRQYGNRLLLLLGRFRGKMIIAQSGLVRACVNCAALRVKGLMPQNVMDGIYDFLCQLL